MRRWLLSATCWMCEYPAVPKPFAGLSVHPEAGASHCKMPQTRRFLQGWGKESPKQG